MFNPKLEDFLKENKNITIIGFYWSLYWRFIVMVYGTVLAISIVISLLNI